LDFLVSLIKPLKALADEKRLKIIHMLIANDLCVGALAKHLGISKPAVSQHLQVLRRAGLVKGEKRGYWTHYGVNRSALVRIASELNALATAQKAHTTICWRIAESSENKPKPKEVDMCQNCCQQPDKLKDKPENCTPEQIRQCHGDANEHPCTKANCTRDPK
jgi:ArsR family transcriptional regulator, arsenate/arsenite/antimonite-responsive transcriptional repressor